MFIIFSFFNVLFNFAGTSTELDWMTESFEPIGTPDSSKEDNLEEEKAVDR